MLDLFLDGDGDDGIEANVSIVLSDKDGRGRRFSGLTKSPMAVSVFSSSLTMAHSAFVLGGVVSKDIDSSLIGLSRIGEVNVLVIWA